MVLGVLYAGMAEQNRNTLQRHACEQQFHGKRIPEPMWVPILDSGQLAEATKCSAPVPSERLLTAVAGPEPVPFAEGRTGVEGIDHRRGQFDAHGNAGLRRLKKQ